MEAEIGRSHCEDQIYQQQKQQQRQLYASKGYNFMSKGKNIVEDHEWDGNNWEWDSNLFIARPLSTDRGSGFQGKHLVSDGPRPANGISNDMYNKSGDAYTNGFHSYNMNDASEKRRKVSVVEEEETAEEEAAACLTLKLGGSDYPVAETDADAASGGSKNGKRSRGLSASSHHHPMCQVDDCKADLNNAKDYHRRHKVCEMHAKANKALVGRLMQRFCQQCSRFHLLQEFDEGKRSCRRRLAGHNRRRRKTHPDGIMAGTCLNDDRGSYSLIVNLLKVLAQLQTSNNSDQASNQDTVLQLLKKLASSASMPEETNTAAAKQSTADQPNNKVSLGGPSENTVPLQNNFLVCNATAENQRPHDLVRPQQVQCSMPNMSTIGSFSVGTLDSHSNAFRKSTEPSICAREQSFVSTQTRNVLFPHDSTQKTVVSVVPQYSHNFWQRREGIQEQHVLAGSVPQSLSIESTDKRKSPISNGFDLNNVYNGPEELVPRSDGPSTLLVLGGLDSVSRQNTPLCSSWAALDTYQTSPPQISDNSESVSDQSPSSSQGDGQDRTGRIVFKLFGKNPSEIPQVLRSQILDWLAHSPSDIESYIRPGCVILTIYLCLSESLWEEFARGFKISLERLLGVSNSDFWKTGWIFAQLDHQIAFIYNGQVLLDISSNFANAPLLLSVTPIAVPAGEKAHIVVKGRNLTSSTSRIICAFQGKHTVQKASTEYVQDVGVPFIDGSDDFEGCTQILCRSFSWSPHNVIGRCFIEVEGHDMSGNFFPVIVAEADVCAEIRTLERYIDMPFNSNQDVTSQNHDLQLKIKRQAIKFLHELGWLFQRSCSSQSNLGILPLTRFSPTRFKWLLEYSTEHDWCSVVRKLLNILFSSNVNGANWSAITMLIEVGILHIAVRRNCREMVEFLLTYVPECVAEETMLTAGQGQAELSSNGFVFKPDMPGPAGLTPLHIAASMENAEGVLDALTNDPDQIGVKAWTIVRDKTGMTPEDYALLRGHRFYIELVRGKFVKNVMPEHVSLDIPEPLSQEQSIIKMSVSAPHSTSQAEKIGEGNIQGNKADTELCQKIRWPGGLRSDQGKIKSLPSHCKLCDQQQLRKYRSRTLIYRPAMLSMMAIATVCVCVTLLLKGPPEVLFVTAPFRWEVVKFGFM